eukprot:TRINITY_DN3689_c0_g1_i2.p2 TRINITY_DN3689_c0_g1~~TRINITY_DN3689_c0_g1_i2.p2  ORF type:complete len:174 (+),score=10.99 TRINITY_DN3689_c0_g1_i2:192-713(+)
MPWQQATDPSTGKPYWYQGQETTWERPADFNPDMSKAPAPQQPPDWQQPPPAVSQQAAPYIPPVQPQPQPQPVGSYQQSQPVYQTQQPMVQNVQPAGAYVMQPVQCQQGGFVKITETRYRMGGMSWCIVILLIFLFWPLCWLPCVCQDCQEPYQQVRMVPVNQVPQGVVVVQG